ncbi:13778_t:CDS:2 [Ambispora leptoticha]|uniref:beta-aspartyl-peptidase n=1 Tax=Ambispora leptoticha TaxID=144679 RepID=A0A9N8Z0F7_9GLOM|nr:13778_t:CDS:2 [Ambispora leptoticha]
MVSVSCIAAIVDFLDKKLSSRTKINKKMKFIDETKSVQNPINHGPTLVIHGGAGVMIRKNYPLKEKREYLKALEESLIAGYKILLDGGSSIDAVEAAVRIMEDCPLFNAGKGSVFSISGKNELEASIMIGTPLHPAGANTLLRTVKNPITLAKTILLDPECRHVFLGGSEAEKYAKDKGLEIVDPGYFWTEKRWRQHMEGLERQKLTSDSPNSLLLKDEFDASPKGTVGAVAVDKYGIIASATSTGTEGPLYRFSLCSSAHYGGLNNKKDGRIGDTPLIGCGTWADNETCGVSGTGDGEFFIRFGIVQDVAARVKYLGENVADAAINAVEEMRKVGGEGGVIAVDKYGNVAMPYNSLGMYRGYIRVSDGIPHTFIFNDE